MTELYPVIGSMNNGNPTWNTFLHAIDNGWHGLQLVALKVFNSIKRSDLVDIHREDVIQDAISEVFKNIDAWDTKRNPVSWASVVMRNKMYRTMARLNTYEDTYDPETIAERQGYTDKRYTDIETRQLIDAIRSEADPPTQAVIDKLLADQPLNRTESGRFLRFRREMQGDD